MVITKLSVPLLLACSLLGAAVTGGATYASVTAEVRSGAMLAAKAAAQVEKLRDQTEEDRQRLKGIESDVSYMGKALEKQGQALDRIERKVSR